MGTGFPASRITYTLPPYTPNKVTGEETGVQAEALPVSWFWRKKINRQKDGPAISRHYKCPWLNPDSGSSLERF
jgi:hypothetical protein